MTRVCPLEADENGRQSPLADDRDECVDNDTGSSASVVENKGKVSPSSPRLERLGNVDLKEKIFINLASFSNTSPKKRNLESISEEESLTIEVATETEEGDIDSDSDVFSDRLSSQIPMQINSWRSIENLACPELYVDKAEVTTSTEKVDKPDVFTNNNDDETEGSDKSVCNSCSNEQQNSSHKLETNVEK